MDQPADQDTLLVWLYALATAALGSAVIRRLLRQELRMGVRAVGSLLLLLLAFRLCFVALPGFPGLCLFCLACALSYCSLPLIGLLPVHQKAILITGLWGVVNNAGVLEFVADAELLPMNTYRRCMEVNYFGAVELTKMFLPLLRQAKGRLVNISSMAGNTPLLGFAAYGASKAALGMFSDILRQELAIWGVKVAIVQPGGFKTGIFGTTAQWNKQHKNIVQQLSPDVKSDYGENYIIAFQGKYDKLQVHSPADLQPVLNDISIALIAKNPKRIYTPGPAGFILPFIYHYLPTCVSDFVIFQMLGSGKDTPAGVNKMASSSNKQ
uniref:17-beta-hydroxysteroid dehydrogenase type 2-like isoform X3 n=1 Tax=Pristiophorus japonicus TaxID=55135 RepID=UPI00398EE472